MSNRETVIEGLRWCEYEDCENTEDECPYFGKPGCESKLKRDALTLLKEQEAEIRQLRLALDIAKGTCNGIKVEGR